MNEFEEIVKERLDKLYEEEETQENNPTEDTPPDEGQDNGNPEEQNPPEDDGQQNDENQEKEESFHAEDLGDFLKKTESKISVKKEGCMPSPIFGNRDTRNHNKFRVYVENKKGKVSFIFWDSIANTEKNQALDPNEALADFGRCVMDYEENPSFEEFKETFGYDETEVDLAQKAYNGCRKMVEKAKKIFDSAQIDELKRLASEY